MAYEGGKGSSIPTWAAIKRGGKNESGKGASGTSRPLGAEKFNIGPRKCKTKISVEHRVQFNASFGERQGRLLNVLPLLAVLDFVKRVTVEQLIFPRKGHTIETNIVIAPQEAQSRRRIAQVHGAHQAASVSYTHLTLPTILRV